MCVCVCVCVCVIWNKGRLSKGRNRQEEIAILPEKIAHFYWLRFTPNERDELWE